MATNDAFKNVQKRIEKSTRDALTDPSLNRLAQKIAKQIAKRTQLGKGVDASGNPKALKKLSPSYKEIRKGNLIIHKNKNGNTVAYKPKKKPRLSSLTTPSKSNLTATGQLLKAIVGRYAGNKLIIEILENRSRELFGGPAKTTHKKIVDHQKKQGRDFFKFTNFEKRLIASELRKLILKKLK